MRITLHVKMVDQNEFTVSTNLWVITQWERKYRRKASEMAQGIGAEDLAFLAYSAMQVAGHTVPAAFDEFIKRLESVDVTDADQDRPTDGEPAAIS